MSVITEYDDNGNLTSAFLKGKGLVVSSSEKSADRGPSNPTVDAVQPDTGATLSSDNYVNWGDNNSFPMEVVRDLRRNGMADRALNLKAEMLYGKRLVTCKVVDFDATTGQETLETVNIPEINDFLQRSNIAQYRNRSIHDFVRLGNCFPMLYLNPDRSKISMIVHDKSAKFRYGKFNTAASRIDKIYRSANWPSPSDEQVQEFEAINSYMQHLEIDRIKQEKHFRYVFPISSYDLLNDYYAVPIWNAVRENGHLKNSNNIPKIIAGMMKNAISLKYHIKIPMSYWTGMYPKWATMDQTVTATMPGRA
ncbi:MAG: hypothetical protein EOO61_09175 [Hymenobacter sp.]|nr:MAG: hypothetical protein EOO61_09175 [Hymenobacter sp.]